MVFHFDRQRLQSAQIVVLVYKRRVRRQHAAVVSAILHDEARYVQLGFQLRERRVKLSVSGKEGTYGQQGVRCEGRVQSGGPSVSVVEGIRKHVLLLDEPAARIQIVRELLPLSLLRVQLQAQYRIIGEVDANAHHLALRKPGNVDVAPDQHSTPWVDRPHHQPALRRHHCKPVPLLASRAANRRRRTAQEQRWNRGSAVGGDRVHQAVSRPGEEEPGGGASRHDGSLPHPGPLNGVGGRNGLHERDAGAVGVAGLRGGGNELEGKRVVGRRERERTGQCERERRE